MAEIQRTTYSVTTTGTGRPDYSPRVAASKLVLDPLQEETASSFSSSISANSGQVFTISFHFKHLTPSPVTVVPTGYKITIGRITVSCDKSLINRVSVYSIDAAGNTFYIINNYRFDTFKEFIFGPQNAAEIEAGGSLFLLIRNNDAESRTFAFNVTGYLEQVS